MHVGVERRNGRLAFQPTKSRHHREFDPVLLELTGLDEDGHDGPVCVTYAGAVDLASDRVQDAIIAILEAADGDLVPRGEIIGRCNYSTRTVTDGLAALFRRGKVRKEKPGKETFYALT